MSDVTPPPAVKRKGGRKRMPAHIRRVQITVVISPETHQFLESLFQHEADTLGQVIDRLVLKERAL